MTHLCAKCRSFHTLAAVVVFGCCATVQAQAVDTTRWTGGAGNWADESRWSNGVPTGALDADILAGDVSIDDVAAVRRLGIGEVYDANQVSVATVLATADIMFEGGVLVGVTRGRGSSSTARLDVVEARLTLVKENQAMGHHLVVGSAAEGSQATGEIHLEGGDLTGLRSVVLGATNGPGAIAQATASLAGVRVQAANLIVGSNNGGSTASNVVTDQCDLQATGVRVGMVANGNRESKTVAFLTVREGDIRCISPYDSSYGLLEVGGAISRGSAGTARGTVAVDNGDILADVVRIGTNRLSEFVDCEGTLELSNGRLFAHSGVYIGEEPSGGFARGVGVLELHRGEIVTKYLDCLTGSRITLGIAGDLPRTGYSQILASQEVKITGIVEARFEEGYLPSPGTVFELIASPKISGDYQVEVTGLDLPSYLRLRIDRSSTALALRFVPEPTTTALTAAGFAALLLRRRRRSCMLAMGTCVEAPGACARVDCLPWIRCKLRAENRTGKPVAHDGSRS